MSVVDPLQSLCLLEDEDQVIHVISSLTKDEWDLLEHMLCKNKNIFAWKHLDMHEINSTGASYQLNILLVVMTKWQKVRHFHPDHQIIIQTKVDKLLEAGFIQGVTYLDWLANVVVVPKKKRIWWVCVDYIDLNDAYPKYNFPLP